VIVFEDSSAATTSAVTRARCLPLADDELSLVDELPVIEPLGLELPVLEPLPEYVPEPLDEPPDEPPEYVPEPLPEPLVEPPDELPDPVEPLFELDDPVSCASARPAASINAVRVVSVFMVISRLLVERSSSMSFMIECDWRVGVRPQE
jgi:hypothetical protein